MQKELKETLVCSCITSFIVFVLSVVNCFGFQEKLAYPMFIMSGLTFVYVLRLLLKTRKSKKRPKNKESYLKS